MSNDATPSAAMPSEFDRLLGLIDGLPNGLKTKPATVRYTPPLGVGGSRLYIVQTIRQVDRVDGAGGKERTVSRDVIFLEVADERGNTRLALPPEVVDVIARQRDTLTGQARRRGARAAVATRKARGIEPAFLKRRQGARKAGKK